MRAVLDPAGLDVADVVFQRALVHHAPDLGPLVAEARRLLRPLRTGVLPS